MSTPLRESRMVQPASPGHLRPGHDLVSLKISQSQASRDSRGHVDWSASRPSVKPEGPPHVGSRDELVRENRALFKKLEGAQKEAQAAMEMLNNLKQGGEAAMGNARSERVTLETVISGLHDELEATRVAAVEEAARLQAALDTCRAELHACNERLARTHATLGLTTERARVLESSRGQLQINLDGTLTTLEEATRQHAQEQAELKHARAAREAELLQTIHQAELRAKASEVKAEVALKRARRFEEELALARRAHLDEKLALTHELERFADRLAVAEGSRLDPTQIGNVAFAAQLRGRPSTASVPTTLLRGRYQRMVPPHMMASPAPA